jgi:hypothetical protein
MPSTTASVMGMSLVRAVLERPVSICTSLKSHLIA